MRRAREATAGALASTPPGVQPPISRDTTVNAAAQRLARDLDLAVRFVDIREDTTLDLDDLERQLSERTRVVAYPWASNATGTAACTR